MDQQRQRRRGGNERAEEEVVPGTGGGDIGTIVREMVREEVAETIGTTDERRDDDEPERDSGGNAPEARAERARERPRDEDGQFLSDEEAGLDDDEEDGEDDDRRDDGDQDGARDGGVATRVMAPVIDLASAKKEADDLLTQENVISGRLKGLIAQWLNNEVTGGDLDEAKAQLQDVAGRRKMAELTFQAIRDRESGKVSAKLRQADDAVKVAIKDFLEGRIDANKLEAVRGQWVAAEADAKAIGLQVTSPLVRRGGGTGTGRRGGPRGTGQRRRRVLRTNAAGDLIYRMKDPSFAHLQEVVEDADGMEDIIDRLATATPQSKERHAVLLNRAQAERIQPLLETHIAAFDDSDQDEKAYKRQFGLLLGNIQEYMQSDFSANQGGDEADEDEDEDEEDD